MITNIALGVAYLVFVALVILFCEKMKEIRGLARRYIEKIEED